MKLHTVSVPCQCATTSSPRPGAARRQALLHLALEHDASQRRPRARSTGSRRSSRSTRSWSAKSWASYGRSAAPAARPPRPGRARRPPPRPRSASSSWSQARSSAACSRPALVPNRCTSVDAASPHSAAAAAKVRASGPADRDHEQGGVEQRRGRGRCGGEAGELDYNRMLVYKLSMTITEQGMPWTDKVALVAGATRGAGRGIAVELGAAGAHVWVTGRSTRDQPLRVRPPGDDRGDRRAGRRGRRHGAPRSPSTTSSRTRCRALVARIERESGRLDVLVNDIWGGERLFEWDGHALGARPGRTGLRLLRLAVETHLITSHHALPLLIRRPGRAGGGDDRRHRRVQRRELPGVGLLRPGQDGGAAAGLEPGPRAGRLRRHRRRADPGLDALGDDARALRRHRGDLARGARSARCSRRTRTRGTSASPRRPASPAGRWPRWPPTRTWPAGTRRRCRRASSPGSTASPTSTAARPDAWRYLVEVQDAGKPADTTGYR